MSWSYSGNPSASVNDRIRFEIQDTVEGSPLLQDEEIAFAVTNEAGDDTAAYTEEGVLGAAAHCLEVLAVRFSMQADTVTGSLTVTYSKMAEGFAARADKLRAKASGMAVPYAGGLSIAEKEAAREDCDLTQPLIRRREFQSPYAGEEDGSWDRGLLR